MPTTDPTTPAGEAIATAKVFVHGAQDAEAIALQHEALANWARAVRSWHVAATNWANAATVLGPLPTHLREGYGEEVTYCRAQQAAAEVQARHEAEA